MKKLLSFMLIFVLLAGCGAKEKKFTPSAENIANLLEEKEIPYTVTNFQHRGSDVVENVEQYTFSLTNIYGENVYALVLNFEGETCCSATLISMLKTQGLEEAQKMIDFAITMYGVDKEEADNAMSALSHNILAVRYSIAENQFVLANGRVEINSGGYHYTFLPSTDDELDYSDEKIRLSIFSVESQEYSEKLEKVQQEEIRKLCDAYPQLYNENMMIYPQLFDVNELNTQLEKMAVPFTVESDFENNTRMGTKYSYYNVYADGQAVGILCTEQFVCGSSIEFTYNNMESRYHETENATEYMVKTVCAAYGVDFTAPLTAVGKTPGAEEHNYYAFDGFYGELMAVGDYSVVNKVPYHFELYDADLFKALLERDMDVSPRYAEAYKEFFE